MIKLTDYICNFIVDKGVKDVFMISGGGAMHLVDSVGRHPKLKYICNHHEQAAAIAAEGYARISGKLGVVVVTSGPGGTNTITGVIGQWLDSVPCLYISGQVKQETTIASCPELGLRQLGDQEINIIDIVKPVTKYAVMVIDPLKIRYYLEKAIYLATHGRPGPVWLDIPLDVQAATIDENLLASYDDNEDKIVFDKEDLRSKVAQIVKMLKVAKRPVFLAGHGIRIAGAQKMFLEIIEKLQIPVLSTFNGFDLIPTDYELFVGRVGTIGDRAGNFAIQNSDLLISVGSRNNIRQVSYNWKSYARSAKKVIVDIDETELEKPTIKPDFAVNADAKDFLLKLQEQTNNESFYFKEWVAWCIERKKKYPVVLPEYKDVKGAVQPYYFVERLSKLLKEDDIVVTGNGTASVTYFQAGFVKKGQRVFWNSGCASMGYDLPAAIGASLPVCPSGRRAGKAGFASNKGNVICIAGDGSLQMNIQELQTVVYHKLPIKLFILDNCGYVSIKQTQDSFFGKRVACCEKSGVSCPDIVKVAKAYGLKTTVIDSHSNLEKKLQEILDEKQAVVCNVKLLPDYKFSPKLSSEKLPDGRMVSKPLEDMYPFLPREEFKENMLIPEWKDSA